MKRQRTYTRAGGFALPAFLAAGALAFSASSLSAQIVQSSAFVSDFDGTSTLPQGPNNEWDVYSVANGNDPLDDSNWVQMTWSGSFFRGQGDFPAEAWSGDDNAVVRPRLNEAAIVTWTAAAGGDATFDIAGGRFFDDTGSSYSVSFRDPNLTEIDSYTNEFADTITVNGVQAGDTYAFIVTKSGSNSQGWGMTDADTGFQSWNPPASNQDGIIVEVVPEPATAALLGGLLALGAVMLRRRTREAVVGQRSAPVTEDR